MSELFCVSLFPRFLSALRLAILFMWLSFTLRSLFAYCPVAIEILCIMSSLPMRKLRERHSVRDAAASEDNIANTSTRSPSSRVRRSEPPVRSIEKARKSQRSTDRFGKAVGRPQTTSSERSGGRASWRVVSSPSEDEGIEADCAADGDKGCDKGTYRRRGKTRRVAQSSDEDSEGAGRSRDGSVVVASPGGDEGYLGKISTQPLLSHSLFSILSIV